MEVFDLDFHILTPGGGEEHIMRVEGGMLRIMPPAARGAGASDEHEKSRSTAAPSCSILSQR
jgi:hypothetical protein